MDLSRLRKWCQANIVVPGLLALDGNNTTYGPTCHMPAPRPDEATTLGDSNWAIFLLMAAAILLTLGILLFFRRRRLKRALDRQVEKGNLTHEERRRLG
jgi:LPXTG-motif cell wall-anchored protein